MNVFFRSCPCCHQVYVGDLDKDMAKGFIAFLNEKYPNSLRLRIRGQITLLEVFNGLGLSNALKRTPQEMDEAISIANDIISMSRRIKVRNMRQYKNEDICLYETYAYMHIGAIAANFQKDIPKALEHFGKALNVAQTHGSPRDIAQVESQIATVKSYADPNNEEETKKQRTPYA